MASIVDSDFDYITDQMENASVHNLDQHQINVACRANKYLEVTFKDGLYHIRGYVNGERDGGVTTAPDREALMRALLAMGGKSVD